jgi:hypothetical protein
MRKASIWSGCHLGDKIISCLILYSIAAMERRKVLVASCDTTKAIIKNLGLEDGLDSCEYENRPHEVQYKKFWPFLRDTRVRCLNIKYLHIEGGEIPSPFRITRPVQPYVEKAPVTYFQFDNRSFHQTKKSMTPRQKIRFLRNNSEFTPVGLGGRDTNRDLPFPYELDGLAGLIDRMRSASQFVGVDSGMSHLAGVLGVPSRIFITNTDREGAEDVRKMYGALYETAECQHDFSNPAVRMKVRIL